jgi:UDP-N-acetylglucosamine--N-acetylmuramyl-(pentapeptide) pyrophosphoryl-undecaprenol N-acetylglucosamine transferase
MRVLISAGGTGGGVYPALAVAQALIADHSLQTADGLSPGTRRDDGLSAIRSTRSAISDLLWVGSPGGMEADLVTRAGLPFSAIRSAGLHGVGWRLPLQALQVVRGFFEALSLVRTFQPEVLFVTGGFVAGPVALAAWLRRVPIMMYVPDLEPGLALQFIGRLARTIVVTAEDSRRYFEPHARQVVVTGYPTRPELKTATRAQAIEHFGLDSRRRTILVTGGSRGARSLNRVVFAALPDWLKDFDVIHLSGQLDWAETEAVRDALSAEARPHYHAFPYVHEMGLALAAADLAVSRAGASALGEYPLFGLPAVLVPYPYAWHYQKVNADYLVTRGAALRVNDEDLPQQLAPTVRALLSDTERLERMRHAAQAAATPDAARRIAGELLKLAGGHPQP